MVKRIALSLVVCAMVICVSFSSDSFALTDEQQQLASRVQKLENVLGKSRSDVYKVMKNPEKLESEECICTYEEGLTTINFQHKKKGKPSKDDTAYYITARLAENHTLTRGLIAQTMGKTTIQVGGQLFLDKGRYQVIASFDRKDVFEEIKFVII